MNFVRHIDERLPKDSDILYLTTKEELEAVGGKTFAESADELVSLLGL